MSWKDDISGEAESGADLSRCFQLSCKVCRRSHQSVCTLIKHAWGHTYEDVGTCGVCGEHTASTEELKTHFLSHETSHTCTVCGQFFITASGFKTHMTQHSAPRMHCSGTCHRDLRTKLVLTNHMKLHQKKESLQGGSKGQASVSQPGVTVQPNDRKDQRLQRQSRKSSCTTSGKRQKSQKQTKINQLKCSKCNRMFWSKIQLEKHMMVHTGVEPHTCDVCGARFHYRVSMKKHLLTHKAGKFGL